MSGTSAWEDFSVQGPFEEAVQYLENFLAGSMRDRVAAPQSTSFSIGGGGEFALHLVATSDDVRSLGILAPSPAPGAPPTLFFLPVLSGCPNLVLLTASSWPLGSVSRSSARQAVAAVRLALAHIARHRRGDSPDWPVLCQVHEASRGAFVGTGRAGGTEEGVAAWQMDSRLRTHEEVVHAGCGIVEALRTFSAHLRDEGSTLIGQHSFAAPLPDGRVPTDRAELAAYVAGWCRALRARAHVCATWCTPPGLSGPSALPPPHPSLARLVSLAAVEVRVTWDAAAGVAWTGPGGEAGSPFDAWPTHLKRASSIAVRALWRHGSSAPLPASTDAGLPPPLRLSPSRALVHVLSSPACGGAYCAGWWRETPPPAAAVMVLTHALIGAAALLRERQEEEEREREIEQARERVAALRAAQEGGAPVAPSAPSRPVAPLCEPSCAGEVGASSLRALRVRYKAWLAEEAQAAVREGESASLMDRVSADAAELLAPLRLGPPDDASDVSEGEEGGDEGAEDPSQLVPSPEREVFAPVRRRDQLMRHLRTGSGTLATVSDLLVDAVQSASLMMGGAPAMLRAAGDACRTVWWPHIDGLVGTCMLDSHLTPCTRLALGASALAIRSLHGYEAASLDSDPLTNARVPASLREGGGAGREARLGRAGPDFFGLPHRSLLGWLAMGLRGEGDKEGGDRAAVVHRVALSLVSASWAAYVGTLRAMWEGAQWAALAAALGGGAPPVHAWRGCLLDQRLELLSVCAAALARGPGVGEQGEQGTGNDEEGFVDAQPSPGRPSATAEEEGGFEDAHSPDSPSGVRVTVVVPPPAELAACGALYPLPGLLMRSPAAAEEVEGALTLRPVYAPRTVHPGPPLPADTALVHARTLSELGLSSACRGGGLGDRLSPALLASDMAAFKAANPGCSLSLFLRWYAPGLCESSQPSAEASTPHVASVRFLPAPQAGDAAPWYASPRRVQAALEQGAGGGGGAEFGLTADGSAGQDPRSARLAALWVSLPPSARCKPVFSPSNAGEEALDALETATVTDVIAQLLACAGEWATEQVAHARASSFVPAGHALHTTLQEDGRACEAAGEALASAVQGYVLAAAVVGDRGVTAPSDVPPATPARRRRGRGGVQQRASFSPTPVESAVAYATVRAADLAALPTTATRLALALQAAETRKARLRAVAEVLLPAGGGEGPPPADVASLIAALAAAPSFTSLDEEDSGESGVAYAEFVREAPPAAGRVSAAVARFEAEARRSAMALTPAGLRGTPWGCQPSGAPFGSQATCPLLRVGAGAVVERSPWMLVPSHQADAIHAVVTALPSDAQHGTLLPPVALSSLLESDLPRSHMPREDARQGPRWPQGLPADAPAVHRLLLQSTEEELRVCLKRAARD